MKFILVVFLGFCALAKSLGLPRTNNLKDKLMEEIKPIKTIHRTNHSHFIHPTNLKEFTKTNGLAREFDNFLHETIGDFNSHLDKVNSLQNYARDKIENAIQKSNIVLEEKILKIMEKINEIKMKGDANKKCAEKYELELLKTKNITINNIGECGIELIIALKDFETQVGHKFRELRFHVSKLINLVLGCCNANILNITTCATSKIVEAKNLIKNIVVDTEKLIVTVEHKIQSLLGAEKHCKQKHVDRMLQHINNVRIKLNEC